MAFFTEYSLSKTFSFLFKRITICMHSVHKGMHRCGFMQHIESVKMLRGAIHLAEPRYNSIEHVYPLLFIYSALCLSPTSQSL